MPKQRARRLPHGRAGAVRVIIIIVGRRGRHTRWPRRLGGRTGHCRVLSEARVIRDSRLLQPHLRCGRRDAADARATLQPAAAEPQGSTVEPAWRRWRKGWALADRSELERHRPVSLRRLGHKWSVSAQFLEPPKIQGAVARIDLNSLAFLPRFIWPDR